MDSEPTICVRCRAPVQANPVRCSACGILHHLACLFPPHHGCAACGSEAPPVVAGGASVPPPPPQGNRVRRVAGNIVLVLLVAWLLSAYLQDRLRGSFKPGLAPGEIRVASGEAWTDVSLGPGVPFGDLLVEISLDWPAKQAAAPSLIVEVQADADRPWLRQADVPLLAGCGRWYHVARARRFALARIRASASEPAVHLRGVRALPMAPPGGRALLLGTSMRLRDIQSDAAWLEPEGGPAIELPLAAIRTEDAAVGPVHAHPDGEVELSVSGQGRLRVTTKRPQSTSTVEIALEQATPIAGLGPAQEWVNGIGCWSALRTWHEPRPLAVAHDPALKKGFALMPGGVIWALGFGRWIAPHAASVPPVQTFGHPHVMSSLAVLEDEVRREPASPPPPGTGYLTPPAPVSQYEHCVAQLGLAASDASAVRRFVAGEVLPVFRKALARRLPLRRGDQFVVARARFDTPSCLHHIALIDHTLLVSAPGPDGAPRVLRIPERVQSPRAHRGVFEPLAVVRISAGSGPVLGHAPAPAVRDVPMPQAWIDVLRRGMARPR